MSGQASHKTSDRRVCGILSLPRYGPMHTHACFQQAFMALGIDRMMYTGAYWDKGIALNLAKAIADGYDYAVCVDMDSYFFPKQLDDLLHLMHSVEDNTMAVFAVQVKRGDSEIIASRGDGKTEACWEDFASSLTKMRSGHFGLTAINLKLLAKMPKPWFARVFDKDGGYGEGGIDPDMYFWKITAEAGYNVYQANRIRIGHLTDCVLFPTVTKNSFFDPKVIEAPETMQLDGHSALQEFYASGGTTVRTIPICTDQEMQEVHGEG